MRSIKALSLTATIVGATLLSGCAVVRNEAAQGSCFADVTQPYESIAETLDRPIGVV